MNIRLSDTNHVFTTFLSPANEKCINCFCNVDTFLHLKLQKKKLQFVREQGHIIHSLKCVIKRLFLPITFQIICLGSSVKLCQVFLGINIRFPIESIDRISFEWHKFVRRSRIIIYYSVWLVFLPKVENVICYKNKMEKLPTVDKFRQLSK